MNSLHPIPWTIDGPRLVARTAEGSILTSIARAVVADGITVLTGDGETCAIVVTGTFDLRGGSTQWQSRGARSTPFAGRPVAVFLPPRTEFAAENGTGEILWIEAKKPEAPAATGREALRQSPLLQLSGSGKSFDPTRGEWMPAESFPTAAESLPPRRIAQAQCGAVRVERVFAADYKAETLVVDEAVIQDGQVLDLALLPLPASATEALVYVRCDGEAIVRMHDAVATVARDGVIHGKGAVQSMRIEAKGAAAYVVIATGRKSN